jgi:DNA-binding GntR family transcriptional regulator
MSVRKTVSIGKPALIDEHVLAPLEVPENETLADRIADRLKRLIVTGEIKPGQKLVEKDIAAAFNVSRTPLREALSRLVNDGLAAGIPYRGIFVRQITLRQVQDIYELRIAIEGLAAMFAAQRAEARDIAALNELLIAMDKEQAGDDSAELKLLNERFHRTIAIASGNVLLVERLDELWTWVSLSRTTVWSSTGRGNTSRDEHHAIYEAIRARDPLRARALAEEHVRRAWDNVKPFVAEHEAAAAPLGLVK